MASLNQYAKNIYSQNGEDGIIEEVLKRLDISSGSFVEFGAWDGQHLSNTYRLLEQGWEGVYIEGDNTRYQDLLNNMKKFEGKVDPVKAFVSISGESSLDNLLASTRVNKDFDILSIDIDSYDWHIWQSLKNYQPKIVIIEINSYIPVGIFQTFRENSENQGSSFSSTIDLGTKKGYVAVCHTGNLIFVREDLVSKLNLPDVEIQFPEVLFDTSRIQLSFKGDLLRKFLGKLNIGKRGFKAT